MTKKRKQFMGDLYAEREAAKYDDPIPSREAILSLLNERSELMKAQKIADALSIGEGNPRTALDRRLAAMVRDGQLIKNRRDGYGIADKLDLDPGRVQGHPDGFGFVIPDGGGEDYYLSPKQMQRVLHGDRVLVSLARLDRRGRREGQVVEILERANSHVVGRYREEAGVGFVIPDEKRIAQDLLIRPGQNKGAEPGDYVYCEILEQPEFRKAPVGVVLDVLGKNINAPMAAEIAIRQYDIPTKFPKAVEKEVAGIPDHVVEEDFKGAKDLRAMPLVTIDGADAKDFDDAVHAKRNSKGGWRLTVAIADVSHYVHPGRPLDDEAQRRSTSVYFPNRVVPMLPEELSNGLCSLKPKVERRAMVCEIAFTPDAKVSRSRFFTAVIRSHARLTYEKAWEAIQNLEKADMETSVKDSLGDLYSLYRALRKRRDRRGAIDFDSNEVGFRFDADGEVAAIVPRTRNDAHKLIEECMIAANVEAAKWLEKRKIPCPFRVHAVPPERKLDDLRQSLAELGFHVPTADRVTPASFSKILDSARSRPDFHLIQALVLRAQSLAVYQPENEGHFGLALEAYAHFTSPIRRYPDLLVHRAIKQGLEKGNAKGYRYSKEAMAKLCEQTSHLDRRAEEAARDVDERLKCSFMKAHTGDEFPGVVSGVTSFGLFVELDNLGVSGLVHVTSLPNDYYHFDPVSHTMTGERRRKIFRLADTVRVQVMHVNVDDRQIDLKIVDAEDGTHPGKTRTKGSAKGSANGRSRRS